MLNQKKENDSELIPPIRLSKHRGPPPGPTADDKERGEDKDGQGR